MTNASNAPPRIAEFEVGRHGGRLGITITPGKKQPHCYAGPHERDLGADLDAVAAWDAAAVVTRMETHELARVGIDEIGAQVRRRHMEWHHVTIVDVSVPDAGFDAAWAAISARLRSLLAHSGHVLVHCWEGLGRSGMLVARLLVEDGISAREAIEAVRAVRPGAIETPSQEAHSTHPGFRWARQTFGPDIVEADAPDICVVQLVPYHSKEGDVATKVARNLPSLRMVQRFVQEALLQRVRSGDAVLIVARSAKLWGVTTEEAGVVVYAGAEPRRAFQTSGSRGGKLLRERLRSKT